MIRKFLTVSVAALVAPVVAFGVQKDNPRGNAVARSTAPVSQESDNNAMTRRAATSVIARTMSSNTRQNQKTVTERSSVARSSKMVGRARTATKPVSARSAVALPQSDKAASRAGVARATAVFNDVSKIGGGYATCRDAYATCMDQICANANDTYRRCFCSDRFTGFRETSEKLDSALTLLAQFQNNNLETVDKTAAEISAMYTASDGEKAIKKDTSASQKLLNNISSILSGKSTTTKKNTLTSLGVLDFSGFTTDTDDIWGGTSSIFGGDSSNLADLEGKALYDKATRQCAEIIRESCNSEAVYNLARSSYSIMISQDCNVYEKSLNAKRASLEETVRTAEKYLRDARLEEYRAHNSADVNECLTSVENAMRNPVACGENYEKCMDYTGRYINVTTGEPIYSKELFGLNSLIVLDGSVDILKANSDFDKWLDKNKKKFAETALDSCRDISDTVWTEFKRSALVQMAQAQDEKIQEVKDSCVTVIKECYDTQSGALLDMDDTELQSTGALAAVAARGMCYERVLACSALYGDPDGCKYDDKTKKLSNNGSKKCGLSSLLTFVDTVDSVKVAEGCETALRKYAHQLCDPKLSDDEDDVYPMGCADMPRSELRAAMELRRRTFCPTEMVDNDNSNVLLAADEVDEFNTNIMNQIIKDIYDELDLAFSSGCEEAPINGRWVSVNSGNVAPVGLETRFYDTYFGITNEAQIRELALSDAGWCVIGNEGQRCEMLGENYAHWENGQCNLTDEWYEHACEDLLGGLGATWVNNSCQISGVTYTLDY